MKTLGNVWIAINAAIIALLGFVCLPVFLLVARYLGRESTDCLPDPLGFEGVFAIPTYEFIARDWLGEIMLRAGVQAFAFLNLVVYLAEPSESLRVHEHTHVYQQASLSLPLYAIVYALDLVAILAWRKHLPKSARLRYPVAEAMAYAVEEASRDLEIEALR